MSDRKIGYAVLVLAGLFILSLLVYVYATYFYGHNRIEVVFPHLGILAIDDAVKIRGKPVGRVRSIERRNNSAVVNIELYQRIAFKSDYHIREHDRRLMGDREIEILPGKNPEPADRSGPLRGEFVPGIAESIPLAEGLKTQIEELLALIHRMADTKNPASFVRQFNSAVGRIDSATGQLVTMVASIEHPVTQSLAQLDTIAGQARQLSSTVLRQAGRAFPKVDSLLAQSAAILTRIEPVVDSLAVLSHAALNDSTVVSQMLRPVSFLDTLNTMIRNLNRELADTRKTGRLNINLF